MKPYLWRFWTKTPPRGRIGILGRSWYCRFLVEGMDEAITSLDEVPNRYYEEINAFERQLVDDGVLLIKFFLHMTSEKQEERFKDLEKNPATSWRVTPRDWKKHRAHHRTSCNAHRRAEGMPKLEWPKPT